MISQKFEQQAPEITRHVKRRWFHTLTGQLVAVMLFSLALSYGLALLLSRSERERALYEIRREDCIGRTASIASLIFNTPEELHPDILRSINSPFVRYWITPTGPDDPIAWQAEARPHLFEVRVRAIGGDAGSPSPPREDAGIPADRPLFRPEELPDEPTTWERVTAERHGETFSGDFIVLPRWNGMGMVFRVDDDLFVNAVSAKPRELMEGQSSLYAAFAISAVALSVASVLVARWIGRPLRRLSAMAERVGSGEETAVFPEEGAEDIRSTAAALNRMQARLRRFVEDRTNMIAAISHDLRTPITSLRLRAEFIEDRENREKTVATLEELQEMTEATLEFAREESVQESTRVVDLGSLVASVCDDMVERDCDVTFEEPPRITLRCRPERLRRAVRNVVENALRYGHRARVSVQVDWGDGGAAWSGVNGSAGGERLTITVDDDGPGIPEPEMERVFLPFVRLETSRSRETGGVGLGLSIARTIVHAHGGEVRLTNRPGGGLRVRIELPHMVNAGALGTGSVREHAVPTPPNGAASHTIRERSERRPFTHDPVRD